MTFVRLPEVTMEYAELVAQRVHRAVVLAESRALVAASIEIRRDSRAAIETSKIRRAQSRIGLARVRETSLRTP